MNSSEQHTQLRVDSWARARALGLRTKTQWSRAGFALVEGAIPTGVVEVRLKNQEGTLATFRLYAAHATRPKKRRGG